MKPIEPIANFGRAPEQGRIRYGVRTKGIPRSISKFRFTSSDLTALEQISKLYGGVVTPWDKGQSEVITSVSEIPVVLPPDPLSQHYEKWAGATCVRRCDGVTAQVPIKTPDGAELAEVPCVCQAEERLDCKATTRVSVILPQIRFAGVWRLDCKGWYASQELPAMVHTVEQLQGRGMYRAFLALEQRQKPGKKFIVPVIRLGMTVDDLLQQGNGPALSSTPMRALESRYDAET